MDHIAPNRDRNERAVLERSSTERIAALTIEFAARAVAAESLDEIHFLLTNDLRTLVGYDRCFLITHSGGDSDLTAATHQTVLDKKSELQSLIAAIGPSLRGLIRPLILHKDAAESPSDESWSNEVKPRLESYMNASECDYLCCIPLVYNKSAVGHLLMEYFGPNGPEKTSMAAAMKIAPVFAAALAGRRLIDSEPKVARRVLPGSDGRSGRRKLPLGRILIFPASVLLMVVFLFLIPFSYIVGGEAVIISREKHYAFCKIGGLIDKVLVRQGSKVRKGETLATLDATDLDYKIRSQQRQYEILTQDMALLSSLAVDDPSKLVKSRLLDLKRKNIAGELEYLKWQARFLEITSPVDGVIVTTDVDTLSGKKLDAGEPFCEIAEPQLLAATVYVPDEGIMRVKKGQRVDVYLNAGPRTAHKLKVYEIAPRAEVQPRLGNVYDVRAEFRDAPSSLRVGMKGIGKIHTGTSNLWTLVTRRVFTQLNRLSLYF
ncbi:MAG: HlyD family efflux transporter periplasmic adaptor subunit [Pseudomonadota bacterium]